MTGKSSDKDARKRPDHKDEDEDAAADLAYEPSVNQTAHHPMPASRDDDTVALEVQHRLWPILS